MSAKFQVYGGQVLARDAVSLIDPDRQKLASAIMVELLEHANGQR
jgi:hypothetical protein